MARRKSINGSKKILKTLNKVMKELDQKYSIKVGIIGSKAYEKHPHSDLTMAQLGAIHEFGATINVTDKMRAYLHSQGLHLRNDTTQIVIPARSFLRDTFFNSQARERLYRAGGISGDYEFDIEYFKYKFLTNPDFMKDVCNAIGAKALEMVQESFYVGGYPTQWAKITPFTQEHRTGDKGAPPLQDTGDLLDSISVEVKRVK